VANKPQDAPQITQPTIFPEKNIQANLAPPNEPRMMPVSEIRMNDENPRTIKDERFQKLCESIKAFPDMLRLRPLVLNREHVVLGGNMRLRACIELGLSETWVVVASNLTAEQEREFIIKDNSSFGQWDWEELATNWDTDLLAEWGLDIVPISDEDMGQFFEERNMQDGQDEIKDKICLVFTLDEIEVVKRELLKHGKTYEAAVLNLLSL
jgi:hypothetical protein